MTVDLFTGPAAQAVGWALLHLVWQAAAIAALLGAALTLLPRSRTNLRYALACAALASLPIIGAFTTWRAYSAAPEIAGSHELATADVMRDGAPDAQVARSTDTEPPSSSSEPFAAFRSSAATYLPWIVFAWLAGVTCFSIRLVISYSRTQRLARSGAQRASSTWERSFRRLCRALNVSRAVELLESSSIEVPTVIGWLKPVVLIPATALAGLTPEQIEMVLAHELAHIRRHDFFINLLQAAVETLMFYHPAAWWISNRVRIEREHCCDDLAIAVCGNPVQYARALTRLEELRGIGGLAMAANGGSLMNRIRRIVAAPAETTSSPSRWAAAAAVLLTIAAVFAAPSLPAFGRQSATPPTPPSPSAPAVAATPATAHVEVTAHPDDMDDDDDAAPTPMADIQIDPPEPAAAPMAMTPANAPEIAAIAARAATRIAPLAASAAMAAVHPALALAPMPQIEFDQVTPEPPTGGIEGGIKGGIFGGIFGGIEGVTPRAQRRSHREFGTNGKLTVDELIELRAVGVTPQYISEMRGSGMGDLTLGDIVALRAQGVTADYVRTMRNAGLSVTNADEVASLKAVGVTPGYMQELAAAGYRNLTIRDLTSLRAVGVTPAYVKELAAAGYHNLSSRELTSLRAVGVTTEYVEQLRAAGYPNLSTRDLTSLRAVGVTPAMIKALRDAGYTDLSPRDLERLASSGVTTDFIRDMSQYRDKKSDKPEKK